MQLYDVGMASMHTMDTEALYQLAVAIGRTDEAAVRVSAPPCSPCHAPFGDGSRSRAVALATWKTHAISAHAKDHQRKVRMRHDDSAATCHRILHLALRRCC